MSYNLAKATGIGAPKLACGVRTVFSDDEPVWSTNLCHYGGRNKCFNNCEKGQQICRQHQENRRNMIQAKFNTFAQKSKRNMKNIRQFIPDEVEAELAQAWFDLSDDECCSDTDLSIFEPVSLTASLRNEKNRTS